MINLKTWFWYVARPNELMLDLDGTGRGSDLGPTRSRLRAAVESDKLVIKRLWLYHSDTAGHFHLVIRLAEPMIDPMRFVWEMQLRSDLYRGRCNIMRSLYGVAAPGLLIAPKAWPGFDRQCDTMCQCESKHTWDVFQECPAARHLRKGKEVGYFGKLNGGPVGPLEVLEGEIALADFL